MQKNLPILAAAFLGLVWPISAPATDEVAAPSHPADPAQADRQADTIDPFALAVPLLNREAPIPSYSGVTAPSGQPATGRTDMMPGMDHGNMHGMDHGNMHGAGHDHMPAMPGN
ncbi:hypothetical protein [Dongia mobilis]|nr:hypothetical protein [Dongia mobilis]